MIRQFILARLAYINAREREFNPQTMRWGGFFYEGPYAGGVQKIHISDLEFDLLDDEQLVLFFERIIRQVYKQM